MTLRPLACLLLALISSACGAMQARAPTLPTAEERCRASAGLAEPVIAEWNAAERTRLESLIARGAVAVVYTGCELRLLPACRQPGRYLWRRTSPSTDQYVMRSQEELGAKLPLAAATLSASLAEQGGLRLSTTVVGQMELSEYDPRAIGTLVACDEATHLLRSIAVGASELSSIGRRNLGAQVTTSQFGASAANSSEESILHRSGVAQACAAATPEALPADCSAPIQLFLEPIPRAVRPGVASAPLTVNFASEDSSVRWDIEGNGKTLCQTPCTQVLDPSLSLQMKADSPLLSGFFPQQAETVEVPELLSYQGTERITVRARPRSSTKFVGGLTLTTFGGLGIAAGVTLASVGYGIDDGKMATAGALTFVAGSALLVPGIWLLVDSMARAEVFAPGYDAAR
jgi:hypothetical protein